MNKAIASCDERLASLQVKLDEWKPFQMMMELMSSMYKNEGDDDASKMFEESKHFERIKNKKNDMNLVRTEKLIYKAIIANKPNKAIYTILLAKYDELMSDSYEMSGNMVNNDIAKEGDHLRYCERSLKQREFIKKLCFYGAKL